MSDLHDQWKMPEPIICSAGGIPYNDMHLKAKDKRIDELWSEVRRLRAQLSAAEKAAVSARNAVIGECAVRALQARSESGASNAIFAHGWDAGCTWAYNAIRILATKDKKGEVE